MTADGKTGSLSAVESFIGGAKAEAGMRYDKSSACTTTDLFIVTLGVVAENAEDGSRGKPPP